MVTNKGKEYSKDLVSPIEYFRFPREILHYYESTLTPQLSKSQYVKGRKCLKRLWLYHFRRELESPKSAFQEGILEQGQEVGAAARTLFPDGVLIDEDHRNPEGAIASTQRAISEGKTVLFEAALRRDDVLIRADILRKNTDGTWDLLEVKSSTSRGKAKKEYLFDLAAQKYVMQGSGIPLGKTCLVRLNHQFRKLGPSKTEDLFTIDTMDHLIERELERVPEYLKQMRDTLARAEEPLGVLGGVCKNPYPCEFKEHCWGKLPPDSIHYLTYIDDQIRAELTSRGIQRIKDIPSGILTRTESIRHWECETTGEPAPDRKKLQAHLEKLAYPLYFLDFETFGYAIPRYDLTRPYQPLTFQYSLHIQREPGGEIEHHEYLHRGEDDPRRPLAESMIHHLGDKGSIIAYYASFESHRIQELAEDFPALSPQLLPFVARMWDLEIPFSQRWVVKKAFQGRSSIKLILPALVPALSYSGLTIKAGDQATQSYHEMISPLTADGRKEEIYQGLLEYCRLDTFAMVKILEVLRVIATQ